MTSAPRPEDNRTGNTVGTPEYRRFVLWDLDHTLLDPAGFGQRSIRSAFSELFGCPSPDGVSVDGRTDRAIIAEFIAATDPALIDRQDEVRELATEIAERTRNEFRSRGGTTLPGATAAVEALGSRGDILQSVLTGNLEGIGRIKVTELGLDKHLDLSAAAFGDAHTARSALVTRACDRAEAAHGTRFEGRSIVIIGDTPLDVEAASAHGAFAIAVATGNYSVADLAAAGADAVLPDLLELDLLLTQLDV